MVLILISDTIYELPDVILVVRFCVRRFKCLSFLCVFEYSKGFSEAENVQPNSVRLITIRNLTTIR